MNDADIELIISLANNELVGQERVDALSRINANPALASELGTQNAMIDAVQSLPGADMTPSERSTLRSNLVEQLHLEEPLPAVVPVKRKVSWWQPVAGLASVAAVVVAIVVVPNMLGSGTDAEDVAFEELRAVSSTEADSSVEFTTTTSAAADAGASIESDVVPEQAPSTAAAADDGEEVQLYRIPEDRQEEFNDLASGETSPALVSEKLARFGFVLGTTIDPQELQDCLDELADELPDGTPLPIGDGDYNTVFLGVDTGDGIDVIVEIDLATCSLVLATP